MNKEIHLKYVLNPEEFKDLLGSRIAAGLPGVESQLKMAPLQRVKELIEEPPEDAIQSSVLLLIYPRFGELTTAVILRSEYDGVHSGQISLPGGRKEPSDRDLTATALRESMEETGIDPEQVEIIGSLSSLYIDRSNYIVYPFVGFSRSRPEFKADPVEVSEIVEIDLALLLSPVSVVSRTIQLKNGFSFEVPGYNLGNHFMWGATAMIFSEFLEILQSVFP